jgi:hypothetical protein
VSIGMLALTLVVFVRPRIAIADVNEVFDLSLPNPGVLSLGAPYGARSRLPQNVFPAFVGDIDADGFADFLVKYRDGRISPYTALVYGGVHLSGGEAALAELPQTRLIHSESTDGFRSNADQPYSGAGDFDGDGFGDFLISAYLWSDGDRQFLGRALLIFGQRERPEEVELESLPGEAVRSVLFVSGQERSAVGTTVAAVGDLNADGHGDIAIVANGPGYENGELGAYRVSVAFGGSKLPDVVDISEIGTRVPGVVLHGAFGDRGSVLGDYVGLSRNVEAAGDINGDGVDDLVSGAYWATRELQEAGLVYLSFGSPSLGGNRLLGDPTLGTEIRGTERFSRFGFDVAGVGDVDGDGLDDVLVGQPSAGGGETPGVVFLIYGRRDWPPVLWSDDDSLRRLEVHSTGPLAAQGGYGWLGWWVDGAGDQNGDGFADLLFSAPGRMEGFDTTKGAVYLVFGGPSLPALASDLEVGTPSLPGLKIRSRREMILLGEGGDASGDLDGDGQPDFITVSSRYVGIDALAPEESAIDVFFGGRFLSEDLRLHEVEPSEGPRSGGLRVELRGSGFRGGERVFFGEVEASEVEVLDSARIEALIPAQGEGVERVSVRVERAAEQAGLDDGFLYTAAAFFPDLTLDVEALRKAGHRTSVFDGLRIHVFSGLVDDDGVDDLVVHGWDEEARRILLWTFPGGRRWPERVSAGELFDHGSTIVGEDLMMFGFFVAAGADLTGDGRRDLAIGGGLDLPLIDLNSPSGKAYVVGGAADAQPARWELAEALEAGDALAFAHPECGSSRVATLETPSGVTLLAISHEALGCRGLASVVKLYAAPLDLAAAAPAPSGVIEGDPTPARNGSLEGLPRLFGAALASGGDLDGDGVADLLVGARGSRGDCYIVLGSDALLGFRGTVNELVERGLAVRLRLDIQGTDLGVTVSSAGDFNGDGLADAALSAPLAGLDGEGWSYVVFGSRSFGVERREIDLRAEDATSHVRIEGAYPGDSAGNLFSAGDFNGDGFDDVAVTGNHWRFKREEVSVVFGRADPPPVIRLRTLGARGFRIHALEGSLGGNSFNRIVAAGDFDADGQSDLAVALRLSFSPTVDRVFVIYGRAPGGARFVRGEVNGDGRSDISDAVRILEYLFLGGLDPECLDAADVDDDGLIAINDPTFLLNFLFLGGRAPPPPYPEPGVDETADGLECF